MAAKTIAAGILLSLLILVVERGFRFSADGKLPEAFTVDGFLYPLLHGVYLTIPLWLRYTVNLGMLLAAFLVGLRIAFPAAFRDQTTNSSNRQRILRRLALGGVLLIALLLFTSQVQPWRVGPQRLWCAVKWPDRTANAAWQGSDNEPLLQQPYRNASPVATLKTGECVQVVGRDAFNRFGLAIEVNGTISWINASEDKFEWLINPARLPIVPSQ